MRMFADNIGVVDTFHQKVGTPAGLALEVGFEEVAKMSLFVTSFIDTSSGVAMTKVSLDGQRHIIPFGKDVTTIRVTGAVIGLSQDITRQGKGEVAMPVFANRFDAIVKKVVGERTYENMISYEAEAEDAKKVNPPSWASKLISGAITAADGIRTAVLSKLSFITGAVSAVATKVSEVVSVVNSILDIPANAVAFLIGGKAEPPQEPTTYAPGDPLTFQELHSLFEIMNVGCQGRAKEGLSLKLMSMGIVYTCVPTRMVYKASVEQNGLINFTMDLTCLSSASEYSKEVNVEYVTTGRSNGVFGQIAEGAFSMAKSAVAGKTAGNVSLGRLF